MRSGKIGVCVSGEKCRRRQEAQLAQHLLALLVHHTTIQGIVKAPPSPYSSPNPPAKDSTHSRLLYLRNSLSFSILTSAHTCCTVQALRGL